MQLSGGSLVQSLSQDYNPMLPGAAVIPSFSRSRIGSSQAHSWFIQLLAVWLELTLSCHMGLSISQSTTWQMTLLKMSKYVSRSVMSDSLLLCGLQPLRSPLFMEFSREDYWSGLPFPTPGKASKGESKRKRERQKPQSSVTCFWKKKKKTVSFLLYSICMK